MTRAILPLAALVFVGCTEPVEAPPSVWNGSGPARTDRLADGGTAIVLLDGGRALVLVGGSVQLHDPRLAEPVTVWTGQQELRGGAWLGEDALLVVTEQGVRFFDGELWPSPLQDALTGEAQALVTRGPARWVRDDAGWHWSFDSAWSTPTLDGEPADAALAPVTPSSAWLQRGDTAILLARSPGEGIGWEIRGDAFFPGLRAIAADGDGVLWATDGLDLLLHADGEDDSLGAPPAADATEDDPALASVADVRASVDASGVWVQTTDGAWHGDATGLSAVDVPDGWWLGVDALGGLVVRTDNEGSPALDVTRAGPALGLWDVPAVVGGTQRVDVTLDPRPLTDLTELQLRLDDTVLDVPDAPPFTVRLPLDGLPRGLHTVTATGAWGSEPVEVTAELDLQSGVVTWADHVRPLAQDECLACHSGNAETILETSEDWQARIELIVEVLEQQKMPLGTETGLPEEQIELVRLWAAGGFQ